jgi:hypothetical protein
MCDETFKQCQETESAAIKLREMSDAVPDILADCVSSTLKWTLCVIINAYVPFSHVYILILRTNGTQFVIGLLLKSF